MSNVADRILIVGLGYAGRRFARSIDYLVSLGRPFVLAGVCDSNPERVSGARVPAFSDVEAALDATQPTVVCVTVNEESHAMVARALEGRPSLLVLSEKPLATSLEEAELMARALAGHRFSMNLVERFSPICFQCRDWLCDQGAVEVVRVDSTWGKHRLGDPRPTMGVLSELIHPLDLAHHLFRLDPIEPLDVLGTSSDFSPHADKLLDTAYIQGRCGESWMTLHSSFVWPRRVRELTAVLRTARSGLVRVFLDFDNPKWDCDKLKIESIGPDGHLGTILESHVSAEEIPGPIRGVAKVCKYIDLSIRSIRENAQAELLVGLPDALRLQREIERVREALGHPVPSPSYFENCQGGSCG